MTSLDTVRAYVQSLHVTIDQLDQHAITQAIDMLYEAWERGSSIFIMGNGGSASTASHFASDLAKFTICEQKPRFKVMGLTDNVPLVSAWTNDSGFGSIFAEQLEPWLRRGDVLVGISVHGGSGAGDAGPWSQNLVRAVQLAQARGARVIGLSGFSGGALQQVADVCITIPASGEPEGTPLVESLHVTVHHLICLALKLRIAASTVRAHGAGAADDAKQERGRGANTRAGGRRNRKKALPIAV